MTAVAMVIRTNVDGDSISDDFLKHLTGFLVKAFNTETKVTTLFEGHCSVSGNDYVSLELHTGVETRQTGSPGPGMTVDVHHNVAKVTPRQKHRLASDIVKLASGQLEIEENRVLVLFYDTRKCT